MRARKIRPLEAAPSTVVRREMRIGGILAAQGKLDSARIEQPSNLQPARGLRFGEAALGLQLITLEDLRADRAISLRRYSPSKNCASSSPDLAVSRDARH